MAINILFFFDIDSENCSDIPSYTYNLKNKEIVILGRSQKCDIHIAMKIISQVHCFFKQ